MMDPKSFDELERWRQNMKQGFEHLGRFLESGDAKKVFDRLLDRFNRLGPLLDDHRDQPPPDDDSEERED